MRLNYAEVRHDGDAELGPRHTPAHTHTHTSSIEFAQMTDLPTEIVDVSMSADPLTLSGQNRHRELAS